MSEERLIRLEDMVGQLIGMVGKVVAAQNEMREEMKAMRAELKAEIASVRSELKAEIASVDVRLTGMESHMFRYQDKVAYLEDKSAEHDQDIHKLKQRVI